MAIGFANLGVSANPDISTGVDASSFSNSSWTPPTTGVILLAISWRTLNGEREAPQVSGNNLTWHHVASHNDTLGGSLECISFFAAFASGATTGATTFDFRGRVAAFIIAEFCQVTGAYESGGIHDAFVQIIKASGSATSGSITLPSAADSNNRPFAVFYHNQNEATTPRTNWTELDDIGDAQGGLETQYRVDTFETTASASWSTSDRWMGFAIEIRDAGYSAVAGYHQDYWQVRTGDTVALDSDTGWAASENVAASILQGAVFRARIKVRRNTTGVAGIFKVQARHQTAAGRTGAWQDGGIVADSTSPDAPVQGKPSSQYADAAATSSELLTSTTTWQDGEGVETVHQTGNILTASHDLDNQETEFEWCLQIQSWYAMPEFEQIVPGDKIFLRVVLTDGTAFPNVYDEVEINVTQNNGYVGGTMAEKPGKVLWIDTNDNLYYYCEPQEWNPQNIMLKSTDRGDTWAQIDGEGRPDESDLEAADGVITGTGLLKIGEQLNNDPWFLEFNLSDAASNPDTWQGTPPDESIKTGVSRDDQVAAIVWRSDGTAIAFWSETGADIIYRIRSSGGVWGSDNNLDAAAGNFTDVVAIVGDSDLTHVFYVDNTAGKLWHNTINSSDTLGTREEVGTDEVGTATGEENPIAGVVRYDSGGVDRIVVAYKEVTADHIFISKVDDNGSPTAPIDATDAACRFNPTGTGNDMPQAIIAVEGTDIYIIYAATDGDLWITKSADYAAFDTDVEILAGADAHFLVTCGAFAPIAGGKYIGYIYEQGSNGGGGQGWYVEYEIEPAGAVDRVIRPTKPIRDVQIPIAHLSL